MWEGLLVGAIVGMAAYFAIRAAYRNMAGKNKACGCGLDTCPLNSDGQCDPTKTSTTPHPKRPQDPSR